MNNKSISISLILFFLLNFSSCQKYLEKKSNNSLVVPTSLSDLQGLLDDADQMNLTRTPAYASVSDDDNFILDADINQRNQREQSVYKWIPYENYSYPNDWSINYFPIYNANYCLDGISQIEKKNVSNESAWDNVKGSALFYRAYYFTELVWTFSKAYDETTSITDLGIALRLTSDFNVPSVRASVKDCYDRIISDTKEAAIYLPDLPSHPYRPSKAAAFGLLARAYLTMRNYDSALKYSILCLQIKKDLIDYNVPNSEDFATTNASFPFKQFNKETIFYTEINQNLGIVGSSTRSKIDTLLLASYSNNDLRRIAYFKPNGRYENFKGSYSSKTILFSGIATDEIFLIKAECYARKGDHTSALEDLNGLLSKRYDDTFMQVTANDPSDALAKILVERRKELLFRGLRFIDIKRLNKEGANIIPKRIVNGQTYTIPPNDNRYALPLPLDVINASGIQQNPY